MAAAEEFTSILKDEDVRWLRASDESREKSTDTRSTEDALVRFEKLWGVNELSRKFRSLLKERGLSIYDRTVEHHFTGSTIIVDPSTSKILLTFHPTYGIWQQLGGHDEGECNPLAVSAREAWEESGINDIWICNWPVRIDPHAAQKCRTVPQPSNNEHYDICYMVVAYNSRHQKSDESDDLQWFSIEEIEQLVASNQAQQRALEMARNSLLLLGTLTKLDKLPKQR